MSLLAVLTVLVGSCGDDGDNGNTGSDNTVSECSAGALRCDGDQLQSCKNNKWTKKEDCANGCDSSSKSCKTKPADPEKKDCTDDELRCDGDQLQICKDNNWTKKEDCANGCDETSHSCKEESKPSDPQCTNEALRCEGNQLQICKDNNWTKKEDCANGCDSTANACKTSGIPGANKICDEGEKKCDGDYIVECKNDTWKKDETACEFGCNHGNCKTQASEPPKPSDLVTCDEAGCFSMIDKKTCSNVCKDTGAGFCYFDLTADSYSCSAVQQEATGSMSSVYPPEDLVACDSFDCIDAGTNKSCMDTCKGYGFNYCYVSISESSIHCSGVQLEATGKLDTIPATSYSPEDLVECDTYGCKDSSENIACSASCKAKGQDYCYVVLSENTYTCSSTQQEATGKPPSTSTTYPPEDLVDCEAAFCQIDESKSCLDECKLQGANYCYMILSENTAACSETEQSATGVKYLASDLAECGTSCSTGTKSCSQVCQEAGKNYCYVVLSEKGVPLSEKSFVCSNTQHEATGKLQVSLNLREQEYVSTPGLIVAITGGFYIVIFEE